MSTQFFTGIEFKLIQLKKTKLLRLNVFRLHTK